MGIQKHKVIIDGWKITNNISGASRYAIEIINEMDRKIMPTDNYSILLRKEYVNSLKLKNIKINTYKFSNKYWCKIELLQRVLLSNAIHIDFFNGFSIGNNSIVTRHDMFAFYDVMGGKKSGFLKSRIRALESFVFAKRIIAVSQYTKSEIIKRFPFAKEKVIVIPNAWQHVKNVEKDYSIIQKYKLSNNSFYLFLGRLVKNKNIDWIFKIADKNKDSLFVIAGDVTSYEKFDRYMGVNNNIIYTGYVTDQQCAALYDYCKAFLFPSLMEGFGIPPMEALFNGKPIIISDIPALKEVYEDAAHYINPYKYDYNLDDILNEKVADSERIMLKYSWEESAQKWVNLIDSFNSR